MKKVDIEVLTGPQGGGKSKTMREETLANPGLYLFALPTHDLIDEQVSDFFEADRGLHTDKVYSQPGRGKTAGQLVQARRDIEAKNLTRAVIFTTHATLMDHDLEGFDGWHIRIDEAPAAVQAGRFNISVSTRSWLKESFDLISRDGDQWSALRFKGPEPDWKAVERDIGAQRLGEFIKQAKRPDRVFVKTASWDATDDIDWFSMWTPLSLSHFASVQVAGSSYTDSVGFKAAESLFSDLLGVQLREIRPIRTGQPTIAIHYFTRGHEGTTTFWESHEGLRRIAPICDYLREKLPEGAFWSGNEIIETVMYGPLTKPTFIQPMAMGLNSYRHARDCAFLFSAKPMDNDQPLKAVFGLTDDQIRYAREDEAIAQFVMRGAIRNLDNHGLYNIYLYSESQAERLRDRLMAIGFIQIDLIPVEEVGIMETTRPKAGRPAPTPEEKEAKLKERRIKDAERKQKKRADDKSKAKATFVSSSVGGED